MTKRNESGRTERQERALAAEQDRKSKKTRMQHNLRNVIQTDSWTLKEMVLQYPHLDWTPNQRKAAGLR